MGRVSFHDCHSTIIGELPPHPILVQLWSKTSTNGATGLSRFHGTIYVYREANQVTNALAKHSLSQ